MARTAPRRFAAEPSLAQMAQTARQWVSQNEGDSDEVEQTQDVELSSLDAFGRCLYYTDEYVQKQLQLVDALADAFFALAQARYALPAAASSSLSPPVLHTASTQSDEFPNPATCTLDSSGALVLQAPSESQLNACIRVVSPLPPPSLRQAQARFMHALQIAVECASTVHSIQQSVNEATDAPLASDGDSHGQSRS